MYPIHYLFPPLSSLPAAHIYDYPLLHAVRVYDMRMMGSQAQSGTKAWTHIFCPTHLLA